MGARLQKSCSIFLRGLVCDQNAFVGSLASMNAACDAELANLRAALLYSASSTKELPLTDELIAFQSLPKSASNLLQLDT